MEINSGTGVAAISLATILAAQPFGISVETVAIGAAFSVMGVFGRAAYELQRYMEGSGTMRPSKIVGWVAAGLLGSPFVTILYLVILKACSVQPDGLALILLLFVNFSGPKAVSWLMTNGMGMISGRLRGLAFPAGQPTPPNPPPPGSDQ